MSLWLAIALGFSGFTALWRSMQHPAHVPPGQPPLADRQRSLARIAGWALISVSFILCAQARGAAIGSLAHGLSANPRQHTNANRRVMPRRWANAATGSAKNMMPNREKMRS